MVSACNGLYYDVGVRTSIADHFIPPYFDFALSKVDLVGLRNLGIG
jgi:hypothetical protein